MSIITSSTTPSFSISAMKGYSPARKNVASRIGAAIKAVFNTVSKTEAKLIRQIGKNEDFSEISTIAAVTSLNQRLRMVGIVVTKSADGCDNMAPDKIALLHHKVRDMVDICEKHPKNHLNMEQTYKTRGKEFIRSINTADGGAAIIHAEILRRYYDMYFVDALSATPPVAETSTSSV